ncbi:MYND Zn finger containing protein, putative [Babesia bigemina]|uniref:MYND Zn finger containing protein, putative n=1 Tax=Babesia bigemina TaxID=5866 RepID=A0A061DC18_BABBI|nr:MYND Zn finger containing protein, putative [Babesia bigemina]CDR96459.1 MYND Zn finger containing protein, putative [Babesia bigemina]|eukprot:XP_012768645.1 MYND Zn finger containing protein, putative [Babesia bigemina]
MDNVALRRAFLTSRSQNEDPVLYDDSAISTTCYRSETTKDELDELKQLFFHSTLKPKFDWAGLCLERQHDFKFWANVTHTFGLLIVRNIFNSNTSCEDAIELQRMAMLNEDRDCYGHCQEFARSSDAIAYTDDSLADFKTRVSFILLSGLLSNRIPGSLRLIVRCNGYQYFEHRISELMNDFPKFDVSAVCFNMNALRILIPYLLEPQSVNLSNVCHRFLTSRFWRIMWLDVGVGLKQRPSTERGQLFGAFLELASTICYGTRSPALLKRLYGSCLKSLWDPIFAVLTWRLGPKLLCRVLTFVADMLMMSFQDNCLDMLDNSFLSKLSQCAKEALADGERYLSRYLLQTLDDRNEFYHHFARIATEMLKALLQALANAMQGHVNKCVEDLYDISSLGTAKLILPPHAGDSGEAHVRFDYSDTRVFPRVLPCFNTDCKRVFHLDMPQLHVDSDTPEFCYCSRCGVPSYCSAACADSHWEAGHRQVCSFLRAPPTFAKFIAPMPDSGNILLRTFDNECTMAPECDDAGNVLTVF